MSPTTSCPTPRTRRRRKSAPLCAARPRKRKKIEAGYSQHYKCCMAGKGDNIKRPFNFERLREYLKTLDFSRWKPSLIVIHHCAAPSLAQRPKGFIQQHMENLEDYYEDDLGWSG